MTDSMAQAHPGRVPLDVPRWRTALGWSAAITLALLFLASGLWKITDAQGAAVRMAQARVPESLSLAAALGFGIVETAAAVLILVPRLRRWGAIAIGVLLVAFLAWFAMHYAELRGAECSCFPWLKRVVGPGFFIGDGVMMVLAMVAGAWAPRSRDMRTAAVIVGAVTVFALVSWGVSAVRHTGTKAPETVLVQGQAYSLQEGRVLLFFFDPECMHCFDAAQKMSRLRWGSTRVVGVPVTHPEYAAQFASDTGLRMALTSDHEKLKAVFGYTAVPAAVALEGGREKAMLVRFEGEEPGGTLRALGLVE
jgi:peroxiredoxin/uncharacterized membrane protein YphA (DoxX/SURF4 family)